jgi:UDP-N-acetylglucosamine 2-epimerase (non-hydrolysing)
MASPVVSGVTSGRVLVVVGTRPEAIKMAPVVRALRARSEVDTRVVFTGQHTSLVDQVLEAFPLNPDAELGIMQEGQSLYDVAQNCMKGLRDEVTEWRPDLLLVQGDTATVFFAALVGFFEKIQVGHVEAGLRSGDKRAPWPEEVLRRLTDQIADLYFAPTSGAREKLRKENVPAERVFVTGNTVVDALLDVRARVDVPGEPVLRKILAGTQRLVLLTAHRRESFGAPLRRALGAVRELIDSDEDLVLLYPVHPNPEVRDVALELLSGHDRIHLVDPMSYQDFVLAMDRADLILSDSGGVQEEAPTFGTPVLVLREVTERPEALAAGTARLVGTDPERILSEARLVLSSPRQNSEGVQAISNPFGDGRAGERIADIVVHHLSGAVRRTTDWTGP